MYNYILIDVYVYFYVCMLVFILFIECQRLCNNVLWLNICDLYKSIFDIFSDKEYKMWGHGYDNLD